MYSTLDELELWTSPPNDEERLAIDDQLGRIITLFQMRRSVESARSRVACLRTTRDGHRETKGNKQT
jgi:hypothetical protein